MRIFPAVSWLSAASLLVFSGVAFAAGTMSSFVKVRDLDFGSFVVLSSCSNCQVIIAPDGSRSTVGGVMLRSNNTGQSAQYTASMSQCGNNCSYVPSATNATMSTPGGSMTVSNYSFSQTSFSSSGNPRTNTLSVGARLTIPSVNVTAGSYSVNFTVNTNP